MVEVMKIMATSFKRSHACTAEFSALNPAAGHRQPTPPPETPEHSQASLNQSLVGSLGPGARDVLFEPSEHLWQVWGLILNVISPFISSCWGFSFALGDGVSLFGGIQHSPVDWYSAASCIFGVLSGEDERVYSVILSRNVCVYLHLWSQSAEYTQDGFIARGVLWFLPDMEGGKNRIEKGRTWA